MTKHELLTKCIAAYQKTIDNLPEDGWFKFLFDRWLHKGICLYIYRITSRTFDDIDLNWIDKYTLKNSNFWYKTPRQCASATEAKETLQYRLNILKKELALTPQ
jgi:hypothetical protein